MSPYTYITEHICKTDYVLQSLLMSSLDELDVLCMCLVLF